jgi:phage gp46-like protein
MVHAELRLMPGIGSDLRKIKRQKKMKSISIDAPKDW